MSGSNTVNAVPKQARTHDAYSILLSGPEATARYQWMHDPVWYGCLVKEYTVLYNTVQIHLGPGYQLL